MSVILRALEPEDVDFMYEAECDEAAWKYSDYLAPLSRELLRQYALTYDADPMRSGQLRMVIEHNGNPAGMADLFDISPRHLRADTGIYVLPGMRGKGIGLTALQLLSEYSRQRLALHLLTATVASDNDSALHCYRNAGFTIAGTLEDWLRTPSSYTSALMLTKIL